MGFFGFAESKTLYVYFAATFALLILVWLEFLRRPTVQRWSSATFIAGVGIWLGWSGLSIYRALVLGDAGRRVFSFVNADVDFAGYCLAEARSLVLCLLVAQLWRGRLKAGWRPAQPAEARDMSVHVALGTMPSPLSLQRRAVCVGQRFDRWQIDSLLLAGAFFPWTIYYWSLGRTWGDPRYYGSTMIWHIVWGICWWCLSAPTFAAWRHFSRQRAHLEAGLVARHRSHTPSAPSGSAGDDGHHEPNDEAVIQWVRDLRPVSTIRVAVTGAASIVTFLLPVFQTVK
jgi:hypothetical protein